MASVARQKSNHAVCFHSGDMEDQCRTSLFFHTGVAASCTLSYQLILNAHLSPLWLSCLLICSASELSITCPIPGSLSHPPSGSILVLMPSIDPSRLPFLLFSLSVASPLFNLIRLLFLSLYPPTLSNLSLSACLHMHYQWHFLCFFPLSVFVKVSPSFLPSPFHLIHSPTLSPSSLSPSPSLGWLAEVSGSPTGHLSLSSQFHSLATIFFFVCFMNDGHQTDAGEASSQSAEVSLQGTRLLCCVWNVSLWKFVLIVRLLTPGVLSSLNCFPSDGCGGTS